MRLCHGLLPALLAGASLGADLLTPEKVENEVTLDNLQGILRDLEEIATNNGGNRASGLPGYKAAVDYVVNRLQASRGDQGKDLDIKVQTFKHIFDQTHQIKVTGPDNQPVYAVSLQYNAPTPRSGITAELVDTPVDDKRGSACLQEQWKGINATGKIALVKRGGCAISDKVKLAKAHGALAVILYNQNSGANIVHASLGLDNIGKLLPVVVVPLDTGTAWRARLGEGGKNNTVSLLVDSVNEERETFNIIAETKVGDPQNVIMLGAHLDTVVDSPGINDDGSGVAALLALADIFKNFEGFNHTVRFAFWAAEERGLLGSQYYVENLTSTQADNIRYYFNYDMIASKKAKFKVLADTAADKLGGSLLLNFLKKHGKPAVYERFGLSSDYVAFLNLGIPSSGIFSGGQLSNTCYHQKCDNFDNINFDALVINTKAAGHAASTFALSLEGVPGREKPESLRARVGMTRRNGDL